MSEAKEMLTFTLAGARSIAMSPNRIAPQVPAATDVTALVPVFTLSPLPRRCRLPARHGFYPAAVLHCNCAGWLLADGDRVRSEE